MRPSSTPPVFILAFVAGVSSLICETVWIHRFSFVFGSTAPAASVVVAVFLGGLAVGSWVFGNVSARTSNPLRVFASLQLAIGVYVFLFPSLLVGGDLLYAGVYPRIAQSVAVTADICFSNGSACETPGSPRAFSVSRPAAPHGSSRRGRQPVVGRAWTRRKRRGRA